MNKIIYKIRYSANPDKLHIYEMKTNESLEDLNKFQEELEELVSNCFKGESFGVAHIKHTIIKLRDVCEFTIEIEAL